MILNFSETYPKGHPRAGEPTHFIDKILTGQKIHSFLDRYQRWYDAIWRSRNLGESYVKIHIFTGARTKNAQKWQVRYLTGIQKIAVSRLEVCAISNLYVYPESIKFMNPTLESLAQNDGFETIEDFMAWMFLGVPDSQQTVEKYIIHWSNNHY